MDYVYEKDTGLWRFNRTRGRFRKGMTAGTMDKAGYRKIHFKGKSYSATRLAYFYVNGKSPPIHLYMDHINGVPGDDRWCNLRPYTPKENANNRKVKPKGLRAPRKKGDRFIPPIRLPEFEDVNDAINFGREAEEMLAPLMKKYGIPMMGKIIVIPPFKKLLDSPPKTLWDEPPPRIWQTPDGMYRRNRRITNMDYLLEVG